MTNLLEKSLLIGFGIFSLMIFFSLIIPFLDQITNFKETRNSGLESYINFISEIDEAVQYVIRNPEKDFLREIEYPHKFNITFDEYFIICDFIIENKSYNKILVYNTSFYYNFFHDIPPQLYLLNVSYSSSLIIVNFINLY